MIRFMGDRPSENGLREIVYTYDPKIDKELLEDMRDFLNNRQATCFNCKNYYKEGCLGGYQVSVCTIYGILEALNNPHYDCDGSKCESYQRMV